MRNRSENLPLNDLVEQRTDRIAGHKDPNILYVGLEHMAQGSPVLLGAARRHCIVQAVENWWDKYRVPVQSIEDERDNAAGRLRALERELGYVS